MKRVFKQYDLYVCRDGVLHMSRIGRESRSIRGSRLSTHVPQAVHNYIVSI